VRVFAGQFGLVPLLDRHPSRLSSGEKRKVLLAQSLGRGPSILLLDEPTSDLDARGSRRLREMLSQVPQTIILATHHYDLALALCRKAVVLGGGKAVVYEDIRRLFDDPAALDRWELL
jgi:cobalt/nickel transport system ATP-binding protein